MKHRLFFLKILPLSLALFFLSASCEHDNGFTEHATLTVRNTSDFDMSGITLVAVPTWEAQLDEFKKGETREFKVAYHTYHRDCGVPFYMKYTLDGQKFGERNDLGGTLRESGGFTTSRLVSDGSHVIVEVKNNGYEVTGGLPRTPGEFCH